MIQRTFRESETVDFVIVGTGAAGGVLAKELATAGFDVVAMEQGPWQHESDFSHDELAVERELAMLNRAFEPEQTFRTSAAEPARVTGARGLLYRRAVGGSSVHFTANFWRFRPVDFKERSLWGPISGTAFADWPITYEELEPYYTKVDWEIGVSGAPGPFDPPRSRPYPMPPLPIKSSGVLLERGARALGLHAQVAPMAILSQPYDGRAACQACGLCAYYRVRVRGEVVVARDDDPRGRGDRPVRDPADATVHRVETERARARHRRRVLGTRRARSGGRRRGRWCSRPTAPRRPGCCSCRRHRRFRTASRIRAAWSAGT